MSKFKFDIIEDTDGTLFYEIEDKPETRQGPFTSFSELFNHLKINMSEAFKKEGTKDNIPEIPSEETKKDFR